MNEYKYFSYYYDDVVAKVKYKDWLDFIRPYLTPNSSILDLACGSGTLAILLKLNGYDVEGLDLSESILEIAKEKTKMHHLVIPYHLANMTSFNLNKKYDVITCFFDSINFLKNETEIDELFASVYQHLNPNGLFIFDVFSKRMLKHYKHHKFTLKAPTHQLIWKTKTKKPNLLIHEIKIKESDETFLETYKEYYHDMSLFSSHQFSLEKLSGDFKDTLDKKDERILFVMKKSYEE